MNIAVLTGHTIQGAGTGAVGILNESQQTRVIAPLVAKYLKEQGNTADLIQIDKRIIVNGIEEKDYVTRAKICNTKTYDLVVEIHLNDATPTGHGTEVYYTSDRGKAYAETIVNSIAELGYRNRGAKHRDDLHILNATKAPAVLVECCFVNSSEDTQRFNPDEIARKIVKGITGKPVPGIIATPTQPEQTDKWYFVQVGAYRIKANAEDMLKKLKAAGFEGYIKEEEH